MRILLTCLILSAPLVAQSPVPRYEVKRAPARIVIDGKLDDKAWAAAPAIEFAIENLLPWAEVELAVGDRDDDLAAHDLAFHMGIGVVFAGSIVVVARDRLVRRQLFKPDLVVVMQATLVVVDENRRGDVHSVDQNEAFAHAALVERSRDLRRDVDEAAPPRQPMDPQ